MAKSLWKNKEMHNSKCPQGEVGNTKVMRTTK